MDILGTYSIREKDRMPTVKLKFFANLREKVGTKSVEIEIPEKMSVLELKQKLASEFPGLQPSLETVIIAVNREFAFDETILVDQAEVALFPPVSGG